MFNLEKEFVYEYVHVDAPGPRPIMPITSTSAEAVYLEEKVWPTLEPALERLLGAVRYHIDQADIAKLKGGSDDAQVRLLGWPCLFLAPPLPPKVDAAPCLRCANAPPRHSYLARVDWHCLNHNGVAGVWITMQLHRVTRPELAKEFDPLAWLATYLDWYNPNVAPQFTEESAAIYIQCAYRKMKVRTWPLRHPCCAQVALGPLLFPGCSIPVQLFHPTGEAGPGPVAKGAPGAHGRVRPPKAEEQVCHDHPGGIPRSLRQNVAHAWQVGRFLAHAAGRSIARTRARAYVASKNVASKRSQHNPPT